MHTKQRIVPRTQLDFDLQGDIPRFWFGGHPFKTRFFDAMSTMFPEGERFFINCVRDFRDQVTDPKLQQEIKDFIRQEAQHGIIHDQFNTRLKAQGINVDAIERFERKFFDGYLRRWIPKKHTLALTAASEHMTAIMAHSFFAKREVLESADPRMRAMYAWHAMEEIEHKAVAFDVMQKVAKVGYLRRVWAMAVVTLGFNIHSLLTTRYMLKVDGFKGWQRFKLMAKGMWWIFKPGGLYMSILGHYLQYYKPGFHPWQAGQMRTYHLWLDTFNRTGDPIQAGEVLHAAGA